MYVQWWLSITANTCTQHACMHVCIHTHATNLAYQVLAMSPLAVPHCRRSQLKEWGMYTANGHTAALSPSPTLTLWDELCCESSSSYSETHRWTRWHLHCMKMKVNNRLCLPACNTIQYPEWTILEPNIRRSSVSGFKFLWKQHTSSSLPLLSLHSTHIDTLTVSPHTKHA